jgi:hypothetical protein
MKRRRFKQEASLEDRLAKEAQESRERADQLPPGTKRDSQLMRARQADTAAHINAWINLLPPWD